MLILLTKTIHRLIPTLRIGEVVNVDFCASHWILLSS